MAATNLIQPYMFEPSDDSEDEAEAENDSFQVVTEWGQEEVKKNHNLLCDKTCRLCCWDMKCQVTQETENLMIRQITGQNAQQAPPLQITQPDSVTQQTAVNVEPQVIVDITKTVTEATNPPSNNLKEKLAKGNDAGSYSSDDSTKKKSISPSLSDEDDIEEDDDSMIADQEEDFPVSDWVVPVKEEFLKKLTYANMKRNLQEQIRYVLRNKDEDDLCEELVMMLTDTLHDELSGVGPEDVLSQSQLEELQSTLEERARRTLISSQMEKLEKRIRVAIKKTLTAPQVQKLDEGEHDFWIKLLDRYLKPIVDTKAHLEEVTRELKSLRNKAVFLYFIINVLWVVATFFLQAIGNDVISIKIPKYYTNGTASGEFLMVEPLSLMFLLSFAILLIIQFLAMLYHRVYTLIHVVSFRGTEKNYRPKEDTADYEDLTLENPSATGLYITSDDL